MLFFFAIAFELFLLQYVVDDGVGLTWLALAGHLVLELFHSLLSHEEGDELPQYLSWRQVLRDLAVEQEVCESQGAEFALVAQPQKPPGA